jgi:hypothetical protein
MEIQALKVASAKKVKNIERRYRIRNFRDPNNWTTF